MANQCSWSQRESTFSVIPTGCGSIHVVQITPLVIYFSPCFQFDDTHTVQAQAKGPGEEMSSLLV